MLHFLSIKELLKQNHKLKKQTNMPKQYLNIVKYFCKICIKYIIIVLINASCKEKKKVKVKMKTKYLILVVSI